jgi:hypothetical protein
VELICPECRGSLQPTSGKMVVCPLHGGEYEVLFDRAAGIAAAAALPAGDGSPASAPAATAATCAAHPRQPAVYGCAGCGKALCATCAFTVDGGHYCSDCAIDRAQATTKTCPVCAVASSAGAPKCVACGHTFGLLSGLASPLPVARPTLPSNVKCQQHPESAAVNRCKVCGNGVCATCDFTFAGNVHVCPTCVDAQSSAGISPERKRKMMWSLGLALWSTLLLAVMFTPLLYRFEDAQVNELLAGALGFGVLIPSIVGTAMGFSAYDRRLRNPWGVRAAVWWNSVLLAFYILLCIIGTMKG